MEWRADEVIGPWFVWHLMRFVTKRIWLAFSHTIQTLIKTLLQWKRLVKDNVPAVIHLKLPHQREHDAMLSFDV